MDSRERRRLGIVRNGREVIQAPDWVEDPGITEDWRIVVDQLPGAIQERDIIAAYRTMDASGRFISSYPQKEQRRAIALQHFGATKRKEVKDRVHKQEGRIINDHQADDIWEGEIATAIQRGEAARARLIEAYEEKIEDPDSNILVGESIRMDPGDGEEGLWRITRRNRGGRFHLELEGAEQGYSGETSRILLADDLIDYYRHELNYLKTQREEEGRREE